MRGIAPDGDMRARRRTTDGRREFQRLEGAGTGWPDHDDVPQKWSDRTQNAGKVLVTHEA